jgi:hypothetical protein
MAQATTTKPLEIDLLVCPTCRTVDKLADATALGIKGYCVGSDTERHPRVRREPARFREVASDDQ